MIGRHLCSVPQKRAPAGRLSSSISSWTRSSPSSFHSEDRSIPQESRPIIFRGGRLTMAARVLPTRSSGLYHMAMPERIWRSVPVPSSRVNRRSFLDFFTASQALTFTTRKSQAAKLSNGVSSANGTSSRCGSLGPRAARRISSSSARAWSMSMRGKRFSPFVTSFSSARLPQTLAESQVRHSSQVPICANSFSQEDGMNGESRMPQMRVASSRL